MNNLKRVFTTPLPSYYLITMQNKIIIKSSTEWMKQAQYDFDTAQAMFDSGRYIYAVFMSHIAVEKTIKGIFAQRRQEVPPKSHDLIYLSNKMELTLPDEYQTFLDKLNDLSVPTRYPDELDKLLVQFDKRRVSEILIKKKEVLTWLMAQL
jgi:HEPN domain-containing protein